jgi:hypothetical protein
LPKSFRNPPQPAISRTLQFSTTCPFPIPNVFNVKNTRSPAFATKTSSLSKL